MSLPSVSDFPVLIQIASLLSLTGFMMICATMVFIYFKRVDGAITEKNKSRAEKIIYEELSDHFLVYNSIGEIPQSDLDHTIKRLNKLKNTSKLFRHALIKTLVHFKRNLSGATVDIINSAYSWLGLREFVLKKLKSPMWFVRTEGLNEIQEMNDASSLPSIRSMAADSNIDVRVTAYAALIKLKTDDCFYFLGKERDQFTDWHQIFLLDAISKVPDVQMPDFTEYLDSENKSIVLLCLKAIIYYKRFETIDKMAELLDHEDDEVRNQLIYALGLLNAEEAEDKLKKIYPEEETANKSQILLALGNIASGASLAFITEQFLRNESRPLLKSAAEAIALHGEESKKQALQTLSNLSEEQKEILKHFQEPLNLHGIH